MTKSLHEAEDFRGATPGDGDVVAMSTAAELLCTLAQLALRPFFDVQAFLEVLASALDAERALLELRLGDERIGAHGPQLATYPAARTLAGEDAGVGATRRAALNWATEFADSVLIPTGAQDPRVAPLEWVDATGPLLVVPIARESERARLGVLLLQLRDSRTNFAQRFSELAATLLASRVGLDTARAAQNSAFDSVRTREARGERESPRGADDDQEATPPGFARLVGRTPVMRRLFEQVRQVAKWNTTALILGESGTGKELIANAIHYNSPRAKGPFIKLNCAALPDNLLESELFGYERGAFTGATTQHPGRFAQAHRGTIFLDEIGEISPSFQAKLLRVLQEGEFERLGGTSTIRVDVRVIAATNRDLELEVAENRFRRDLYYRLNVMPLRTPPLRDRLLDIEALARHLVGKLSKTQGRSLTIEDGAIEQLRLHDWPGNVRELENCLERAAILSDDGVIDEAAVQAAGVGGNASLAPASASGYDLLDPDLDEKERVLAALEQAGWVQAKAARLLGMSPRQVAYRIQTLRIDVKRF